MTPATRPTYLHVHEIGDDGRIDYEGRFDEDDFEGAYRELERRYYARRGRGVRRRSRAIDGMADRR